MEIFNVVGEAIGAIAHIEPALGWVTLCGLSSAGFVFGRRFFMPSQSDCKECLDRYAERKGNKNDFK